MRAKFLRTVILRKVSSSIPGNLIAVIFFLLIITFSGFAQNYSGKRALIDPGGNINESLANYDIQLFPNQSFTGYYYFWSNGSPVTASLQELPAVGWLDVNPSNFTSNSCSDIVPVAFQFTAPSTPGNYYVEIRDLNNVWESIYVNLTVTDTPSLYVNYQTLYATPGQVIDKGFITRYNGLDVTGWSGYCGPLPYIPGPSQSSTFFLNPSVGWLNISPTNFTVNLNDSIFVQRQFTSSILGTYETYEVRHRQWISFPVYTHWTFKVQNFIPHSIEEVQYQHPDSLLLYGDRPSPYNGQTIILRGVVMVDPVVDPVTDKRPIMWAGARWQTYLSDPDGTIYPDFDGLVVLQNDTTGVNQGTNFSLVDTAQVIEMTATISEYSTTTEGFILITPVTPVTVIGQLPKRPDPVQVSISDFMSGGVLNPLAEKYEGEYVIFRNVFTSNRDEITGTFRINDGLGNYVTMYDQSGYFTKRAHRLTGLTSYEPPVDSTYIGFIRGLIQTRADGYYIAPIYPGDINYELIDSSLVAYYPFNGDTLDYSIYGNTGTRHGGVTWGTDRFDSTNRAVQFNGIDGYIEVPNSISLHSPTNAVTIAGWMYIESFPGLQVIGMVMKTLSNTHGQYGLGYTQVTPPGSITFVLNGGAQGYFPSVNLSLNTWHFISSTYDGSEVKIYIDGNIIGTQILNTTIIPDSNPLSMGIETNGAPEYLHGKLDDIRIYNRALTGAEIQGLYLENGWVPATFPLTVLINNGWNMVSIPGLHPVNQNVLTWWPGKDPSAGVFKFQAVISR